MLDYIDSKNGIADNMCWHETGKILANVIKCLVEHEPLEVLFPLKWLEVVNYVELWLLTHIVICIVNCELFLAMRP